VSVHSHVETSGETKLGNRNYVAVAADTFSSELGILATSLPRLITAPWQVVPRGTNGGVTVVGILAGLLGSTLLAVTAGLLVPFCNPTGAGIRRRVKGVGLVDDYTWNTEAKVWFVVAMAVVGLCGSLLDSLLGALVQASVVDVRTGKVVEGDGGKRVELHAQPWQADIMTGPLASGVEAGYGGVERRRGMERGDAKGEKHESRRLEVGRDLLDNNGVNFAMALIMSCGAMVVTCLIWRIPVGAVVDSVFN
jgi:uncharacterized membrane protein